MSDSQARRRFLSVESLIRGRRALTGGPLRRLDRRYVSHQDLAVLEARVGFLERVREQPENESLATQALVDLVRPRRHGHLVERLGCSGDGGYVIAADLPLPGGAVSVGVGSEHSADVALARMGIHVEQFDHTVPEPAALADIPDIHFNALGLGTVGAVGPFVTLEQMCAVGPWAEHDDLWLLIDCEGSELPALEEHQNLSRFSQISIELHSLELVATEPDRILNALAWLVRTHVPIALHANNYGAAFRIGGRSVPTAIELTLVRTDLFRNGANGNPVELMRPNDPGRPDLDLCAFIEPTTDDLETRTFPARPCKAK